MVACKAILTQHHISKKHVGKCVIKVLTLSAASANAFFGNTEYSREELVAEIGSAMLCNRVGIEVEKAFRNSVAYIKGWLKALKNDTKMIVWAATRAEKAAKFILNEF